MLYTPIKTLSLTGIALLSLAACSGGTEKVEDMEPEVTQDTFEEEIEVREGSTGRAYEAGDNTITINSVDLFESDDNASYFQYQPVHVNATIENNTEEDQEFDVWSQLRVGSVRDRDAFGALQLSTYGLDDLESPELNDNLYIELDAGEAVTYDFLYDVIVPEENNDVHVIYQIDPMSHYEDGYITWDIDGFSDLEPSEVEEIDWDAIEDEGEPTEEPEDAEDVEEDAEETEESEDAEESDDSDDSDESEDADTSDESDADTEESDETDAGDEDAEDE